MNPSSLQPLDRSPTTSWWSALLEWFEGGEPHPVRGPFARWPRATDAVIAVAVFAGSLVTVAVSDLGDGEDLTVDAISDRPLGAFAMLAVAAAALLWRRMRPIGVAVLVTAIMIGWAVAGYGDGQDLALIVAVYSVGRYTSAHGNSVVTVAGVMVASILATFIDPNQRVDIAPAIILAGLPWYVGRRVRNRGDYMALLQERAERLEADQHARARQAVADERSRIARELHDVVAHQVSMMTIQAGAARTVARDDLDAAIEAMAEVELTGRHALGELRHLLGVLRPDTADGDDLGPQPGMDDIPSLADQLGRTGAEVTVTLDARAGDVGSALDLSAYRIVQESITNIMKHAGPSPEVDIAVGPDGDVLVITVTNTTHAVGPDLPSSGYGIVGMRERANLLGGTLTAGPQPPDRFCVEARLPLHREPT